MVRTSVVFAGILHVEFCCSVGEILPCARIFNFILNIFFLKILIVFSLLKTKDYNLL